MSARGEAGSLPPADSHAEWSLDPRGPLGVAVSGNSLPRGNPVKGPTAWALGQGGRVRTRRGAEDTQTERAGKRSGPGTDPWACSLAVPARPTGTSEVWPGPREHAPLLSLSPSAGGPLPGSLLDTRPSPRRVCGVACRPPGQTSRAADQEGGGWGRASASLPPAAAGVTARPAAVVLNLPHAMSL